MERVYVPDPMAGPRVEVAGPEAHHLSRVRRIGEGEPVVLFDGRGGSVPGRIETVHRDRVVIAIEGPRVEAPDLWPRVTLASAVPKGDRVDWLVEKAVELGVRRFVPLRTERSVVDPRASKLDRLRRTIVEASKQCGRDRLMELDDPVGWASLIDSGPDGEGLIAHPGGLPVARLGSVRWATIAIGPEGGFTDAEVERAVAAGWRTIGLGPTILRIETAALASCAVVLALGRGDEE